jgi:hypothetical protein
MAEVVHLTGPLHWAVGIAHQVMVDIRLWADLDHQAVAAVLTPMALLLTMVVLVLLGKDMQVALGFI